MSETSTLAATCPGCTAPLTGAPRCPGCDLRLVGPDAQRLWQVDQRLAALGHEQSVLTEERQTLLAGLALDEPPATFAPSAGALADPYFLPASTGAPGGLSAPASPGPETQPANVQNTLLALGGGLLALAAFVFAAVTYSQLGQAGRALVLLTLTLAAVAASAAAAHRHMRASAEAAAFVAVALGVLDVWAVKHAGLVGTTIDWAWWFAGGFAVLAAVNLEHARQVGVRLPLLAGVVFAHLPVPILLADADPTVGAAALALAVLTALDVGVLVLLRGDRDSYATSVRTTTGVVAVIPAGVAALLALVSLADGSHLLGAAAFAVLAASVAALTQADPENELAAAGRVLVVVLAAAAVDGAVTAGTDEPGPHALVAAAATLLVALGAVTARVWPDALRTAAPLLAAPAALLATAAADGVDSRGTFPTAAVVSFLLLAVAGAVLAATTRHSWRSHLLTVGAVLNTAAAAAAVPSTTGGTRVALLAGVAVIAAAVAANAPARLRWGAAAGAAVTSLSAWWLFLEQQNVDTTEAHTLPLAGVLLAAGWLVRHHRPTVDSPRAYTAGLVVLLAPSVLETMADTGQPEYLTRALLLVAGATLVLLAGAALKLRAPVVAGAAALGLTALRLVLPYADDVPRWIGLGLAGALLLAVGATYEARRRDIARLRDAVTALD